LRLLEVILEVVSRHENVLTKPDRVDLDRPGADDVTRLRSVRARPAG
jgi:hypothetical protein